MTRPKRAGFAREWRNYRRAYKNGKWNRLNGPAIESDDGRKWWYVDGNFTRYENGKFLRGST